MRAAVVAACARWGRVATAFGPLPRGGSGQDRLLGWLIGFAGRFTMASRGGTDRCGVSEVPPSQEATNPMPTTPESLRALIARGETLDVEFKGELRRPFDDRELVETVVCLANRPGTRPGWLLIGVEDDGRVTGARARHGGTRIDPDRIVALVANRTRPSVLVRVDVVELDDKPIVVIEVPPSRTPVGTADGRYLRRAIGGDGRPACMPMHFYEMQAYEADRGQFDWSASVVPQARWEDLDPLEFERLRRAIRERRGRSDEALLDLSDLDVAKALGTLDANGSPTGIRAAGLLMFGRPDALQRLIPTHEVAFQVLHGRDVEINEFYRWPLLRVMEEIEQMFRARNGELELLVGMLRIGIPDYAPAAFREGLANALVHRDYTQLGAVHVQWYADRIVVSNPGGFPEGVHLDNLLVTPPRPRNPLLADVFKRVGLVERTARGIDTIFYEQLRNGHPAPSYARSDPRNVVLELFGGRSNRAFVQLLVEESQAGHELGLDDLLVLDALLRERSVTTERIATWIQKPAAEARVVLHRLLEAGLVEARGSRRGRTWHLSASTCRRLGMRAAYVRQRGFEPIQQEQMVLQYVDTHGRITRGEAATLCQVTPDQAYRVLSRLVERGQLVRRGAKRGTWYARPPARGDDETRARG